MIDCKNIKDPAMAAIALNIKNIELKMDGYVCSEDSDMVMLKSELEYWYARLERHVDQVESLEACRA